MNKSNSFFHLVTIRPWPFIFSFSLINFLLNILFYFHLITYKNLLFNFILILIIYSQWIRDIIRERTYQGFHTIKILQGLKISLIIFITSELFLFISFFWTYFHSYLSPRIEIGNNWPPKNILKSNPYDIPLLNTIILLSSGISITWSHHNILNNNKNYSLKTLILTIFLGIYFILLQIIEYYYSSFTFIDSLYGSIFFIATGFHGIHVIIGFLFLTIRFIRLKKNHFSSHHHFLFEASSWYWHFVDLIWLFLYIFFYWWNF